MTDAAEQAGIHRNTINVWRRNSRPFSTPWRAQYDRALLYRERAEVLADRAVETITNSCRTPRPAQHPAESRPGHHPTRHHAPAAEKTNRTPDLNPSGADLSLPTCCGVRIFATKYANIFV